jgi:hypothetical protein
MVALPKPHFLKWCASYGHVLEINGAEDSGKQSICTQLTLFALYKDIIFQFTFLIPAQN